VTDRPIIFSAPMIRALLDGRKTQTRRVLKPHGDTFSAPSYRRGDRLYVREAAHIDGTSVNYRADHPGDSAGLGWRPSIHMPRWASRLTLTVTDVRVQQLQEISADDAVAEGCHFKRWITGEYPFFDQGVEADNRQLVRMYRDLWNSLHGTGAWDANPWVVAISFTVQRGNIDQIGGAA